MEGKVWLEKCAKCVTISSIVYCCFTCTEKSTHGVNSEIVNQP